MSLPVATETFPKTITLTVESSTQEFAARRALLLAQEVESMAGTAASGSILEDCEMAAVESGRDLTRQVLERAVQTRVDALEKKTGRYGPATAAGGAPTKGPIVRRS